MTRNKHHLTVIPILGKVIRSYIILNYEKNSLSNFTHLNKIKWRIFIPVQKAWFVKKLRRVDGSKKIPEFLSKGGVVQFCRLGGCFNLSRLTQIRFSTRSLFIGLAGHGHIIVRLPQSLKAKFISKYTLCTCILKTSHLLQKFQMAEFLSKFV